MSFTMAATSMSTPFSCCCREPTAPSAEDRTELPDADFSMSSTLAPLSAAEAAAK